MNFYINKNHPNLHDIQCIMYVIIYNKRIRRTFFNQRLLTKSGEPPTQQSAEQREPIGISGGGFSRLWVLTMVRRQSTGSGCGGGVVFLIATKLFDHGWHRWNRGYDSRVVFPAIRRHLHLYNITMLLQCSSVHIISFVAAPVCVYIYFFLYKKGLFFIIAYTTV